MPTIPIPISTLKQRWRAVSALAVALVVALLFRMIGVNQNAAFKKVEIEFPRNTVALLADESEPIGGGGGGKNLDLDRKVIRTGTIELEVESPAEATENIRLLAERLGGYLVSSQISGSGDMPTAAITIRVPAARFEEAVAEIKRFAARVETEKTDATDVTRAYVDKDARLRNLRATEAQYLGIMKRATTVKDTLEVSEKLSEVRGQIEQTQAEFDALAKQVETVAISVSMRALADTRVFGLHWRPWYQLKLATRDGMDGLGNYAATMAAVIMYLPTVFLWVVTILVGAAIAWRILRWAARVLFSFPSTATTEKGS